MPEPSIATVRKLWVSCDPKGALKLARRLQKTHMAFLWEKRVVKKRR